MKTSCLKRVRNGRASIYAGHNRALVELAKRDERIVSCYADFAGGAVAEVYKQTFPDRYIDVGIAEGHLITAAAGLAEAGYIPFTHCHTLFALGRGYNQIRQNVAYDKRNVKIVLCTSGVVWGGIGPSHHSVEDIAALRAIPNLALLSPADDVCAQKATVAAAEYKGPVAIRLHAGEFPTVYTNDVPFEVGKSICLSEGTDATIVATGILVHEALSAAEALGKEGIHVRVLDMHTVKPLDETAVMSAARETGAIVTAEDATVIGGLGGAVSELVSQRAPAIVKRVGIMDRFGDSGTAEELQERFGLTAASICSTVRDAVAAKG